MNLNFTAYGILYRACLKRLLFTVRTETGRSRRGLFERCLLLIFLLPLLHVCFAVQASAQSISFSSPTKYASGGAAPTATTVGDFNSDGKTDLAIANQNSNNVGILLGNSAGTLSAATSFTAGYSPRAISTGDLNGDGRLDIVVGNETGNDLSVLMGNGDGTFQQAISHGPIDRPEHIAIADINLDGKQDLAVASFGGSVFVLFGNGDGTFQPAANYTTGLASTSVAVGDFNKDGKPDLAVANQDSGNLSVLINSGAGTFSAAANYATAPYPVSVSTGDLNGDSNLDLVTAAMGPFNNGYFEGNGFVSVLLGNGGGTFKAATSYEMGMVPHSVVIGDLNQDGLPELAVANAYSSAISVLAGNGDGTFGQIINVGTGDPSTPFSLSLGDFNQDGMLDIATANFIDGSTSVLINQTTTLFLSSTTKGAKSTTFTKQQDKKITSSPKQRR